MTLGITITRYNPLLYYYLFPGYPIPAFFIYLKVVAFKPIFFFLQVFHDLTDTKN